jgi:hypothetical protein
MSLLGLEAEYPEFNNNNNKKYHKKKERKKKLISKNVTLDIIDTLAERSLAIGNRFIFIVILPWFKFSSLSLHSVLSMQITS